MNASTDLAWLAAAFAQSQGAAASAAFLQDYRQGQFDQFKRRGLPSRREEAWKYTDLSFLEKGFQQPEAQLSVPESGELRNLLAERAKENELLVFVNGAYAPRLSAVSELPEGVILCNLQTALEQHASLITAYLLKEKDAERYPFASLNAAFFKEGLFLYVPRSTVLKKPLHFLFLSAGTERFMIHPRHLLILENEASLTVTEEYRSEAETVSLTNVCADFFIGRDAVFNYHKIQSEGLNAKHLATLFIHQKQNSRVNAHYFTVGGQFIRNEVHVHLQEAGAACHSRGFYGLESKGQVIDHHLVIDHAAPKTRSALEYRGVISGQSRAVFNGKVRVRQQAKQTEATQYNHNLLLSPLAEVDSKPELEIYADAVQCRHGATTGQLDEEALFYLRSRGLDLAQAKLILLQAFVEAVLSEIQLNSVKTTVRDLWRRYLNKL